VLERESRGIGYRAGVAKVIADLIKDPIGASLARAQILAATSDVEALRIAQGFHSEVAARLNAERSVLVDELAQAERLSAAVEDIADWWSGPFMLGRASDSQFHRVCDQNLMMLTRKPHPPAPEVAQAQSDGSGIFLVQHDWAGAFATTDADIGEWRMPYDRCVFEMEISGRRVCAIVASEDGVPYRLLPVTRAKGGWIIARSYAISGDDITPEGEDHADETPKLGAGIMAQVKAIAIMLDAEVAVANVVRAPNLSPAQERRGERKAPDHHVLSLTRRARALGGPVEPSGRHKRLHFRRGHWRHYPSHKTWIRWCLVGDPSLGFADKDYRL
jgi:hypothetical protein